VYTILIEKESFSALADFPEFASEVENINIVVSYFERRLERIDDNSVLSVTQVCPFLCARSGEAGHSFPWACLA